MSTRVQLPESESPTLQQVTVLSRQAIPSDCEEGSQREKHQEIRRSYVRLLVKKLTGAN